MIAKYRIETNNDSHNTKKVKIQPNETLIRYHEAEKLLKNRLGALPNEVKFWWLNYEVLVLKSIKADKDGYIKLEKSGRSFEQGFCIKEEIERFKPERRIMTLSQVIKHWVVFNKDEQEVRDILLSEKRNENLTILNDCYAPLLEWHGDDFDGLFQQGKVAMLESDIADLEERLFNKTTREIFYNHKLEPDDVVIDYQQVASKLKNVRASNEEIYLFCQKNEFSRLKNKPDNGSNVVEMLSGNTIVSGVANSRLYGYCYIENDLERYLENREFETINQHEVISNWESKYPDLASDSDYLLYALVMATRIEEKKPEKLKGLDVHIVKKTAIPIILRDNCDVTHHTSIDTNHKEVEEKIMDGEAIFFKREIENLEAKFFQSEIKLSTPERWQSVRQIMLSKANNPKAKYMHQGHFNEKAVLRELFNQSDKSVMGCKSLSSYCQGYYRYKENLSSKT